MPLDPEVNSGLLHKEDLSAVSLLGWMFRSVMKPTEITWDVRETLWCPQSSGRIN